MIGDDYASTPKLLLASVQQSFDGGHGIYVCVVAFEREFVSSGGALGAYCRVLNLEVLLPPKYEPHLQVYDHISLYPPTRKQRVVLLSCLERNWLPLQRQLEATLIGLIGRVTKKVD